LIPYKIKGIKRKGERKKEELCGKILYPMF
jgi:hypothetical protein